MNELSEREAFEKITQDVHGLITEPFAVWMLAKEHAKLMARKGCFLQYDGAGDWWIVIPGVMRQGTYKTKEEAEQLAVREGLRIDTPKTEFLDVY